MIEGALSFQTVPGLLTADEIVEYQAELDRLNTRYRINQYKAELMDIYRQATRLSIGR